MAASPLTLLFPLYLSYYGFGRTTRPPPLFGHASVGRRRRSAGRPSPNGNVGYHSIAPLATKSNYFGAGGRTGAVAMGGATGALRLMIGYSACVFLLLLLWGHGLTRLTFLDSLDCSPCLMMMAVTPDDPDDRPAHASSENCWTTEPTTQRPRAERRPGSSTANRAKVCGGEEVSVWSRWKYPSCSFFVRCSLAATRPHSRFVSEPKFFCREN